MRSARAFLPKHVWIFVVHSSSPPWRNTLSLCLPLHRTSPCVMHCLARTSPARLLPAPRTHLPPRSPSTPSPVVRSAPVASISIPASYYDFMLYFRRHARRHHHLDEPGRRRHHPDRLHLLHLEPQRLPCIASRKMNALVEQITGGERVLSAVLPQETVQVQPQQNNNVTFGMPSSVA